MNRLEWIAIFLTFGIAAAEANEQFIVKFREGLGLAAIASRMSGRASWVRTNSAQGFDVMRARPGDDVDDAIRHYRSMPQVEYVEKDNVLKVFGDVSDPMRGSQWALNAIRAYEAWDIDQGNSGIIIAIIDTGVDLDHSDLASKLVPGYDFVQLDNVPDDDHGHGTHCAGIAAASTNNGTGVAGVGYGCRVMPIKVLSSTGSGYMSDVASGITWAVDNGAKVISMSLGGSAGGSTLENAVNYAWSHGVLVVSAAGNNNSQEFSYPGAYTNSIGVGALDQSNLRASFSNYGPWVDVAAPGVSILSTYLNGQYAYMSGTSMATPVVAGVAGLVWSHLGSTTNVSLVRQAIESHTHPVGSWVAFGAVDAVDALGESAPPPPPIPTEFPPSSYRFQAGSLDSGSIGELVISDDQYLVLASNSSRRSNQLDVVFTFAPVVPLDSIQLKFSSEEKSSQVMRASVYVYNAARRRWVSLASTQTNLIDSRIEWTLSGSPSQYRDANGNLQIRWISSGSRGSSTVSFDQLQIKVVR